MVVSKKEAETVLNERLSRIVDSYISEIDDLLMDGNRRWDIPSGINGSVLNKLTKLYSDSGWNVKRCCGDQRDYYDYLHFQ